MCPPLNRPTFHRRCVPSGALVSTHLKNNLENTEFSTSTRNASECPRHRTNCSFLPANAVLAVCADTMLFVFRQTCVDTNAFGERACPTVNRVTSDISMVQKHVTFLIAHNTHWRGRLTPSCNRPNLVEGLRDGEWCNGSTERSGRFSLGSNPSSPVSFRRSATILNS